MRLMGEVRKMTRLLTDPKPGTGRRTVLAFDEAGTLVLVDGKPCRLTTQEYRLLLALAQNAGTTLSRDRLLFVAWDYQSPGKSRTVDVHVQRLRRKLGETLLETVHGIGYRLRAVQLSA